LGKVVDDGLLSLVFSLLLLFFLFFTRGSDKPGGRIQQRQGFGGIGELIKTCTHVGSQGEYTVKRSDAMRTLEREMYFPNSLSLPPRPRSSKVR